jgi:Zn-dependent alcohol dehydrogenase
MRTTAAVLTEVGASRPYARTRPLEVAEVYLDPPGPGEVLVRVEATGLCHSDLSVIDGSRPRPVPMVLGHEACGVIEDIGRDVADFRAGDRVVFAFVPSCGHCLPCQSGRVTLCEPGAAANTAGTLLSGERRFRTRDGDALHHHLGVSGLSERTVAATASLVKVETDTPPHHAALFGCALLTGVGAVVRTGEATPGSSVGVFGLGGVGLSAVIGAVLAGAHPVVAVDRVAGKLERARTLGATHTVLAGDDAVAEVRDLSAGGVDLAVEAVGSATVLADAYAATRRGGTTVSVGLPDPSATLEIPALSLVAEERRLVGSYMGSAVPRRDVPRLMRLHAAGRLPVEGLLGRTLPLHEVNAGFDALHGGEVARQVVAFEDDIAG